MNDPGRKRRAMFSLTAAALAALAVLAAGTGCQTRATLVESAPPGANPVHLKFTSDMAVFNVDANGRQTIVLALQPSGQQRLATAPPPPAGMAAPAQLAPLRYRIYLELKLQGGGGDFQIGQRLPCGPVCATYFVYNEYGQANVVPDARGTVQTKTWPLMGGIDPNDWLVSGTFDLVMSTQISLSGSFVARSAPVLVGQFMRDRKL
jgi:hypothetical protein